MPITVDQGPLASTYPTANIPYVSVTVCPPGNTSNCQTIDHIIVDTGSSGLRVIASVLNSNLLSALPQNTIDGTNLNECLDFVTSYVWGSVRTADVVLASEQKISSLALQVIGDSSYPNIPSGCGLGTRTDTVATFGANGILGVSFSAQDCGQSCAQNSSNDVYYVCTSANSCSSTKVPIVNQVQNPVTKLAGDNNGVIVQLPQISNATGASSATGYLILGVATQSNNTFSGTQYPLNLSTGTFLTDYVSQSGRKYTNLKGFLDSGSNAIFFDDSGITQCSGNSSGYYCPSSTLSLTASNYANTTAYQNSFSVANADILFNANNGNNAAFSNLAGKGIGGFDFGLSFFYGKNVTLVFEGSSASGISGPFVAY